MISAEFIKEDAPSSEELYAKLRPFFKVNMIHHVGSTADSMIISGSLVVRDNVMLSELPYRFNRVDRDVVLQSCDLRNLKNFPQEVHGRITISNNPNLHSLITEHPVTCENFDANTTGIESLDNCDITCYNYLYLGFCRSLKSVSGFRGKVGTLMLESNFELSDMNLLKFPCDVIVLGDLKFPKLKLCQLTVLDVNKKIDFAFSSVSPKLVTVLQKYQGTGAKAYVSLLNELKDSGFGELAKRG